MIRAVLAEFAPDDVGEFEAEFRIALAEADDTFDLAPVHAAEERAAVARARAGDFCGIRARTATGDWIEL
ncbi:MULTISPECIES: DUF6247 family protein [Mycobacterium avium complex (MAC)]|uniref:DUF6247 family protein n=1 Tax=Mycobacterium avium complex (MAC) TaxID=120793 RepID=UPI001FC9A19C|nr:MULTISPECIES: DUF6247 family protein [Mycobacterium avium complex (MAC)]